VNIGIDLTLGWLECRPRQALLTYIMFTLTTRQVTELEKVVGDSTRLTNTSNTLTVENGWRDSEDDVPFVVPTVVSCT